MTLVSTVGGASGPLYGTFFLRMGAALGDSERRLTPAQLAAALRAGLDGVVARGKAEPGDKTMYDALAPAVDALDAALASGKSLADALAAAESGRRGWARRHDADARAQGPGQLSRRAQRRPSGPRRNQRPRCLVSALLDDRERWIRRCDRVCPARSNVGIVVVSHSRALAQAAVALAVGDVARPAGPHRGRRRPRRDHLRHRRRRGSRRRSSRSTGPAGVVVLMDLGSAVLSTELALDLLADPTARDRVVLSPAADRRRTRRRGRCRRRWRRPAEVAAEARGALLGKAAHLSAPTDELTSNCAPIAADVTAVFTVTNRHGLHARPAARLVERAPQPRRDRDACATRRPAPVRCRGRA